MAPCLCPRCAGPAYLLSGIGHLHTSEHCISSSGYPRQLLPHTWPSRTQHNRQHTACSKRLPPLLLLPLQLLTWAASSVSFAFTGSNVTVVIDGSLASLPAAHRTRAALPGAAGFPWCSFQVGHPVCCSFALVQLAGRMGRWLYDRQDEGICCIAALIAVCPSALTTPAVCPCAVLQFVLDGQASVGVTQPQAPVLTWTRQLAPGKLPGAGCCAAFATEAKPKRAIFYNRSERIVRRCKPCSDWLLPALPSAVLAPPIAAGKHTITITKLTQALTGSAWLTSLAVGGGSFLPPPLSPGQASGRRMLFMGDSCEYGKWFKRCGYSLGGKWGAAS